MKFVAIDAEIETVDIDKVLMWKNGLKPRLRTYFRSFAHESHQDDEQRSDWTFKW